MKPDAFIQISRPGKDFSPLRLLIFFLVLSACISYQKPDISNSFPERAYLIPGVPFFPQKDLFCGPASLQAVLSYYGKTLRQDEISEAIYLPQIKGTLNFDLVNFARSRGFQSETPAGSLEEIERRIRENHPVIAFLNLGTSLFPLGHYIVIIGFDHSKGEIIFHSGPNEFERLSNDRFLKQWQATDYWMLVITPPAAGKG